MSVTVVTIITTDIIQDAESKVTGAKPERVSVIPVISTEIEEQADRQASRTKSKIRLGSIVVVPAEVDDDNAVRMGRIVRQVVDIIPTGIENEAVVTGVVIIPQATDSPAGLFSEIAAGVGIIRKVARTAQQSFRIRLAGIPLFFQRVYFKQQFAQTFYSGRNNWVLIDPVSKTGKALGEIFFQTFQ